MQNYVERLMQIKKSRPEMIQEDNYTYELGGTIPANGELQVSFQVESDSAFSWIQSTRWVDENTVVDPVPDLTLELKDGGSGRFLQQNPVNVFSMAGTAELPHILARPRLFAPNALVTGTFVNNTGEDIEVKVFFQGIKTWIFGE